MEEVEARVPPLLSLDDAGIQWAHTPGSLQIRRRFHLATVIEGILLIGGSGAVTLFAALDGQWFVSGIVAFGMMLWTVGYLARVFSGAQIHLDRDALRWSTRFPRRFVGAWPRSELGRVRVVYDIKPKWHERIHMRLEIERSGAFCTIGTATAYGFGWTRRRVERLGEALGLALARPVVYIIEDEQGS